tara:strand:- start:81 stop:692 length:612 start_codon:yes stop_codon:yes gene_type:complete
MIHHIIKPFLLFSIILLSCSNPLYDASEYIVPEKSKQELKDYLIKNRFNLNPIEGIWTLGVIRTLYENGKMIAFEEEAHRMGLAVIKEGDLFRVYDVNGEPTNFIATFKETDELGKYDYQCHFTDTKDHVSTTATMFGNSILQYKYDAPKGIMMKYYYKSNNKDSKLVKKMIEDGSMRLQWQFIWAQYYPYSYDKKIGSHDKH